jgi:hypothetical protein
MIGTNGIKKKELNADIILTKAKELVSSNGKNNAIATDEPHIHIIIHFLYTLLRLCIGPIIATPIIPEIIGLPPTKDTASGKKSSNHGFNI